MGSALTDSCGFPGCVILTAMSLNHAITRRVARFAVIALAILLPGGLALLFLLARATRVAR